MSTASGGPAGPQGSQDLERRAESLTTRLDDLERRLQQARQDLQQLRSELRRQAVAEAMPPVAEPVVPATIPPAEPRPLVPPTTQAPVVPPPQASPVRPAPPAVPPAPAKSGMGNLEAWIGGAWLSWLAGICALLTAAWFFKYAAEQGWISPWLRVLSGWAACAVLLGIGEWGARRGLPWFAAGVTGSALGLGYLASYAASPLLYDLISLAGSYAVLSVVTAVGLAQAIRLRQLPTAVLALLGGFLTLVLLKSPNPTAAGLLGYLVALNTGALAAGQVRHWPVLRALGWAGTAMLIAVWLESTHERGTELGASLTLLPLLFAMFQLDIFVWRLRRPEELSQPSSALSGLNCTGFVLAVWGLLLNSQVEAILGTTLFLVAVFQTVLARALWVIRPSENNRNVSISFYGQGSMAAAVGLPVAFDRLVIVAGWAVQAVTVAWLVRYAKAIGLRLKVPALLAAAIIYIIAFFDERFMTSGTIATRCWLAALVCAAGCGAAWLMARCYSGSGWKLERAVGELCAAVAMVAGVLAIATWFSAEPSVQVLIWSIAAVAAAAGLLSYRAKVLRLPGLMTAALVVASLLTMGAAGNEASLVEQVHRMGPVTWSMLLPVGLALAALGFWNVWLLRMAPTTRQVDSALARMTGALAAAGLLVVLHGQLPR